MHVRQLCNEKPSRVGTWQDGMKWADRMCSAMSIPYVRLGLHVAFVGPT